jgi:hypothetical protein
MLPLVFTLLYFLSLSLFSLLSLPFISSDYSSKTEPASKIFKRNKSVGDALWVWL